MAVGKWKVKKKTKSSTPLKRKKPKKKGGTKVGNALRAIKKHATTPAKPGGSNASTFRARQAKKRRS